MLLCYGVDIGLPSNFVTLQPVTYYDIYEGGEALLRDIVRGLLRMVDELQQKKHTAEDILQILCNVLKSMLGG